MSIRTPMIMLSSLALASAANPRPQLPHCECLAKWPHSDDLDNWQNKSWGVGTAPGSAYKFTQGPATGEYGQAIPATTSGCFDAGLSWGDGTPANAFKICIPDTSAGPCIGYGDYDGWIQSFYMTCGIGETGNGSSNANPVLKGEALRAAAAFEAAVTELVESPLCECQANWSDTDLARRFCGGNAHLAVAAGVDNETCNAPVSFNNAIDDKNNGSVKQWVNGSEKWCAVKTPVCSADNTHVEPCSKQKWIKLPIVDSTQHFMKAHGMVGALKARSASISPPIITSAGKFTAMTFYPAIVTGLYMNDDFGAWRTAIADVTAVYNQYDKPDITPAPLTAEQELALNKSKEKAANITAEKLKMCEENPKCKAKADAQECEALASAALKAFPAPTTPAPPVTTLAPTASNTATGTTANTTLLPASATTAAPGAVASSAMSKMPSIVALGCLVFAVAQLM